MMGQKGASLNTTRRIHRKLAKDLAEFKQLLAAKRQRPGYDAAGCLTAEVVQLLERQLSGASPPVGVLKGLWRQVCDEYRKKEPEAK